MLNIEELEKELARMRELEESAERRKEKLSKRGTRNHRRLVRATALIEDKERYDKAWAYQERLCKIIYYSIDRACMYSERVEALENLIKLYN